MTTVDVLTMAAPPAPVSSQPRQAKSDGFARELEAATRPMTTRAAQADDSESRPAHDDKSVADTKAHRAHERHEPTRRAQSGAKDAADASVVSDRTADSKAADAKAADDRAAKDATSEDLASDGSATAAPVADGKANDVPTTDSAGPGTASSGEASQDPAVIAVAAPAAPTTVDVAQAADESSTLTQAASALEPSAAAIPQAGVTDSRSSEPAAVKVTGSATPEPAASGEKVAGPVAGGGAPTGGADGQSSGGGSQGQARQGSSPAVAGASAPATEGQKVPDAATLAKEAPTSHATSREPEVPFPAAGVQTQVQGASGAAPTIASIGTDAAPGPTSELPPTAVVGPTVATANSQATAPAAAPASASAPTFPVPLASQLSGQLATLRQLPQGEHVLTLTVNPETFGPVKVIAHISRDGVSLEIFGASDQARAALKAALPDLRRDLAGTGLEPKLELGTGGSGGRDSSGDASAFAREGDSQQRPARQTFGATNSAVASPVTPTTTPATRRGGLDLVL